jgi:hypothetical protein
MEDTYQNEYNANAVHVPIIFKLHTQCHITCTTGMPTFVLHKPFILRTVHTQGVGQIAQLV